MAVLSTGSDNEVLNTETMNYNHATTWATTWQTNKMNVRPAKTDQPGHQPNLIRHFAVRMKKAWFLSDPLSAQRRLWSDCADAQADLSLRWAPSHFVGFVMMRLTWLLKRPAVIARSIFRKIWGGLTYVALCWINWCLVYLTLYPYSIEQYLVKYSDVPLHGICFGSTLFAKFHDMLRMNSLRTWCKLCWNAVVCAHK